MEFELAKRKSLTLMNIMKILTSLLFIALCIPVSGRIGETYDECVQRYGKPKFNDLNTSKGQYQFIKKSFMITVYIHKGKADGISYSKTELTSSGGARFLELKNDEISLLQRANSQQPWSPIKSSAGAKFKLWTTADARIYCTYHTVPMPILMFFTPEWQARQGQEEKEQTKKGLDGF